MITVSSAAAEKVKNLMTQNNLSATGGLRLGVRGGGCSGLSYVMEFAESARPDDQVYEQDGIRLFVDPKSQLYLDGTELDYVEGIMGAGFEFKNPNVKRSCACGSSFTV
jgi:iron-sulfur cluster assembly protein